MLINGTIIKVYKYVYKYNRAFANSDLGGLVIQPAVRAIIAYASLVDYSGHSRLG